METRYLREILRLHYREGIERTAIASSLGISYTTVTRTLRKAEANGGEELEALADPELEALFYPARPGPKTRVELTEAELGKILRELKRRGVTRQLLYREYVAAKGEAAMSYTSFCEHIRQHAKALRLSMLLEHDPGAEMYIDYCGDRVPIHERSGEVAFYAEIFVATLAASGYTYFEAHPSQDAASFCAGITRALEFFGGTTSVWVPDNLKAGVITNTRTDLRLSRAMCEMAAHYQVVVEPARPGRPKDKARVEERVGYIQRNALAALRNQLFYSIDELNRALITYVGAVNARPMAGHQTTRAELFEKEREYLRPLPLLPFSYGTWHSVLVPPNYHIELLGCRYSVPHALRGQVVEAKLTEGVVEIYAQGKHVVTHRRGREAGSVTTLAAHRHPRHAAYLRAKEPAYLIEAASAIGDSCAEMARAILARAQVAESGPRSVRLLLALAEEHGNQSLEAACAYGLSIGAASRKSVASILSARSWEHGPHGEPPSFAHANLRFRTEEAG